MSGNSQNTAAIHSFDDTRALSEARLHDPKAPAERKKRVVVTGGSGGLGRWVVREMVDHGWDVYNCMCSPDPLRLSSDGEWHSVTDNNRAQEGDPICVWCGLDWRAVRTCTATSAHTRRIPYRSRITLTCSRHCASGSIRGRRQGSIPQGGPGRLWTSDRRFLRCGLGMEGRGRRHSSIGYPSTGPGCKFDSSSLGDSQMIDTSMKIRRAGASAQRAMC